LENAQRQDKFNLLAFDALIARSPGRHGIKPLQHALDSLRDDPPWTQSELERAFLALTRQAGLPTPLLNQFVEGELVDAICPSTTSSSRSTAGTFTRPSAPSSTTADET